MHFNSDKKNEIFFPLSNDLEEANTNYQTHGVTRNRDELKMSAINYQLPPNIGDALYLNPLGNDLEPDDSKFFPPRQNNDEDSFIFLNQQNQSNQSNSINLTSSNLPSCESCQELNNIYNPYISKNGLPKPINLFEGLEDKNQENNDHLTSVKRKKNKGRPPNNGLPIFGKQHTKEDIDNLQIKIKRAITNAILNCINDSFINKKRYGGSKTKKVLQKLMLNVVKKKSKNDINIWLQQTVANYFSSPVCKKARTKQPDYNRNQIERIINDNTEKRVIRILNMKIGEFVQIFYEGVGPDVLDDEIFDHFEDMKHVLEFLKKEKGFSDNYIERFKLVCKVLFYNKWLEI